MDNTDGQIHRAAVRGGRSADTRGRLLNAAAELIAELGWGRVTTRAVAEKAELPHGAVSYHFQGKQDLLTLAALRTVERMFPVEELADVSSLADLVPLVHSWMAAEDTRDPVQTGVLMEAMRESERNPALRYRLAATLRDYRRLIAEVVRADQDRDVVSSGLTPSVLATLIAAAGDGLLLHSLLDPELDVVAPVETLVALLRADRVGDEARR